MHASTFLRIAAIALTGVFLGISECAPNIDVDEDGYTSDVDCDDEDPTINPSAAEVCDNKDNNCDGSVDEGVTTPYYPDVDGDGVGDSSQPIQACTAPSGTVSVGGDCNDADPAIKPGAKETCDGLDNDCDLAVDDGVLRPFYPDVDRDGYGAKNGTPVLACTVPSGYQTSKTDCNDNDPNIKPGATEVCDTVDNDCDGIRDEGFTTLYFLDHDHDGYGADNTWVCTAQEGYILQHGDCNDQDATIRPGATESCDAIDNNCDGTVDGPWELQTWYQDLDGDGFGTESETSCKPLPSFVTWQGDCDETRADVHPGAFDKLGDGVDLDCGGTDAPQPHVGFPLSGEQLLLEALELQQPGETLWIGPGTYLEHSLEVLTDDAWIRSVAGADETILDAAGQGRVMSIHGEHAATVRLEGLTFTNGALIEQDGAGLWIQDAQVELQDIRLISNEALGLYTKKESSCGYSTVTTRAGKGGGLYALSSTLDLEHLDVRENEAGAGAGLWLENCTLTATDLQVNANEGLSHGSKYYCFSEGDEDSSSQSYYQEGGALALVDTQASMSHASFTSNRGGNGAGIYLLASRLTLSDATIQSNIGFNNNTHIYMCCGGFSPTEWRTALSVKGGGLYASLSTLEFYRVAWSQNRATEGAGLYLVESSATSLENRWTGNQSPLLETYYLDESSPYDEGEYAPGRGGALMAVNSTLTLGESELTSNTANQGGGLLIQGGDLTVRGLRGVGQQASSYTVSFSYDEKVSAPGEGGTMFLSDVNATLHSTALLNSSATNGAGILHESGTLQVSQSVMTGNRATQGGGILTTNTGTQDTVLLDNTILAYNQGYNLESYGTTVTFDHSNAYNPPVMGESLEGDFDTSPLALEPQFLTYTDSSTGAACVPGSSSLCLPADLHLTLTSGLVNGGDPSILDLDGSRSDLGIYGGQTGDVWDVDQDGVPDYFWPGEYTDVPSGVDPAEYDRDDQDGRVR